MLIKKIDAILIFLENNILKKQFIPIFALQN